MRATSAGAGTVPAPLNTARHAARRRWRGAGAGATSAWTRLRLASRRRPFAAAPLLPSTFINAAAVQVQQLRIHGKCSQNASPPAKSCGERERSRAQICRTDATKKQGAGRMTDKEQGRQVIRAQYMYAHTIPRAKTMGHGAGGDQIPVDSVYFSLVSDSRRRRKHLVLDQRPGCADPHGVDEEGPCPFGM